MERPVPQRIANQGSQQRKQQADIGVEKRTVPFAQHHRRKHHFRHDRKDEGLDEAQSAKIVHRPWIARPDQNARIKLLKKTHQPMPPSKGTKLTAASSSCTKS